MDKQKTTIYRVYFENEWDDSENDERFYNSEENADKKYRQLCRKYWVKPSFCFTDKNWYCIWYGSVSTLD